MDLDTFLTTLYVLIDDWYREILAEQMARTCGSKPEMSDSEVLTVAIAGQWRGSVPWQSERGVVRYMQTHGRSWFPSMLQRSAFNERVRNLWAVIVALQQQVAEWLHSCDELYEVVDCVPLPACSLAQTQTRDDHWLWWSEKGRGGTHSGWYWGEQVLVSVTSRGVVTGWIIGSPHADDRWFLQALLSHRQGKAALVGPEPSQPSRPSIPPEHIGPWRACGTHERTHTYLADQGFNGYRWHDFWAAQYQVEVLSAPPANAKQAWARHDRRWIKSLCQIVETVFACLTNVLSWQNLRAHSRWGQYTRVALALAAHNFGILLNRLTGRPDLAHETLIC